MRPAFSAWGGEGSTFSWEGGLSSLERGSIFSWEGGLPSLERGVYLLLQNLCSLRLFRLRKEAHLGWILSKNKNKDISPSSTSYWQSSRCECGNVVVVTFKVHFGITGIPMPVLVSFILVSFILVLISLVIFLIMLAAIPPDVSVGTL